MKEFKYAFQISKMIIFEVSYYTLGGNAHPYFATSAEEFIRSKRDYHTCGQAQRELLNRGTLARSFYEKWDKCHCEDLTAEQYAEVVKDIEQLKSRYNHIEIIEDTFKDSHKDIYFHQIKELSKLTPKK